MALLNPPQTLPHVMLLVYRYLLLCAEKHTEDVSTLRGMLAPPALRGWQSGGTEDEDDTSKESAKQDSDGKEQKVVRIAINALRELGIIEDVDNDRVRISPDLPAFSLNKETGERSFRRLLRDRVLEPRSNSDLWLEEGDGRPIGPRDLTRALAWTLAQDPYQPLRPWKDSSEQSVQHVQQRQLGQVQKGWVFSNEERWKPFVRWAVYLGFAWKLGVPKVGTQPAQIHLVPDPTVALRDVLVRIVPEGAKVPMPELVARISHELPVLDGGTYREAVVDRIERRAIRLPGDGELSLVLAHALLRLQDDEVVTLLNESDTDKRLFPTESGDLRPFSHLRLENRKVLLEASP